VLDSSENLVSFESTMILLAFIALGGLNKSGLGNRGCMRQMSLGARTRRIEGRCRVYGIVRDRWRGHWQGLLGRSYSFMAGGRFSLNVPEMRNAMTDRKDFSQR